MNKPETLEGTQDKERRQTKHKNTTSKTINMSNTDPTKTRSCVGEAVCWWTQVFAKGGR